MEGLRNLLPGLDVKEQRFLWLVRLRFISLLIQIPLSLVGRYYGYLDQRNHIFFAFLFSSVLIYNSILYKRITTKNNLNISTNYLNAQISLDLILFTLCLLLSGGSNNPLYAVYYVIAVIGGIFTVGSGCMFFVLLISCILLIQIYPIFITSYALDMMFNLQTMPYLASQILIPAGTYLIAHSFGELLVKSQNSLIHITVQNERLDRLRALGALSSGFSHEFASPLHAAKIRLKRLERQTQPQSDDLNECMLALDECEIVLKRMNSSQLSMDDSDLEVLELDLIIKETSSKWKEEFPATNLHLLTVEEKIRANRINLTQTILNLLDNAAESMDFKGTILVQLETDEDHVMLSIQDEGAGFTTDVLGRLGEPFNTNKENGTGLGLYSSLLFMHAVAGELKVFNNPDKGATVKMLFPKVDEA